MIESFVGESNVGYVIGAVILISVVVGFSVVKKTITGYYKGKSEGHQK